MVIFRRPEEGEVSGIVPPLLGQEALQTLVLLVEDSCMDKVELRVEVHSMTVVAEVQVDSRILGKAEPRYTRHALAEVGRVGRPIMVERSLAQASEEDIYRVGCSD